MPPAYLAHLAETADREKILALHQQRRQWVEQDKKGFRRYRDPCRHLSRYRADHLDCSGDSVIIGRAEEVPAAERPALREALRAFMPWRKGPFSVFGVEIDAEWRSERKWQRLLPALPALGDLAGKVVADIGCNNGYYMFRMLPAGPRLVLGFEPTVQHYFCCTALQAMAGQDNLAVDLLGVEHLPLFAGCFDVVFLMGILYHRPSPIDTLRDTLTALRPGGRLIVETQAIPGEEPLALCPADTYAKAPGTYFVPTGSCLLSWLNKAGFVDCKLFSAVPMSAAEQRPTEWMTFESYENFISTENPQLTVEGYPAPWRLLASARKNA